MGLSKKLKYYKAICIRENRGDYTGAKRILFDLIECDDSNEIIKCLGEVLLGEVELNICNAIAVNEAYHGYFDSALSIFYAIRMNMLKFDVISKKHLVKINYNIVKLSYESRRYDDVLKFARLNIDLCKKERYVPFLGATYMYLANSMKQLGYPEAEYTVYYKKFIYIGEFFGEHKQIRKAKRKIVKDNEIYLDEDLINAEV